MIFGVVLFNMSSNSRHNIDRVYNTTNTYFTSHSQTADAIFNQLFPQAATCNNAADCRIQISRTLNRILQQQGHPYDFYESTYFIRIESNPDRIEKLFLDGQWQTDLLKNSGPRHVYRWLKTRQTPGYLQGTFIDQVYSDMIYFQDFYSEAEIVIPIFLNNQVVGAAVVAYGD